MDLGEVPRMSLQSDGFTGTFKGKAPVVITDVAAECGWTATAVWSDPARFADILGDAPTVLHCRDGDDSTGFSPTNRKLSEGDRERVRTAPWNEAVAAVFAPEPVSQAGSSPLGERLYLKSDMLPPLLAAVTPLPGVALGAEGMGPRLAKVWCGSAGVVTSLHFDLCHGLIAQAVGRKRIILFAPEDSDRLYPYPAGSEAPPRVSRMDLGAFMAGDPLQCAEFVAAAETRTGVACEIGPGEALYIPPFWWHYVAAVTTNVSVLLPWDLSAAEQSAAARPWTKPGWGQGM